MVRIPVSYTHLFTDIAQEKGIQIQTRIEPGLQLTADQTLMIRLLGNLLENAVNYGFIKWKVPSVH